MRIIRKAPLAGAVLATAAAGLTVLAGAAPAGAHAPPHGTPAVTGVRTAAGPPVLLTCTQRPQFAPRRVILACGGRSDYLRHLNWAVWTTTALATGTQRIDDCVPDCARGTFRHYRVLVTLWRARPLPGTRHTRFTRLTVIYTRTRPATAGKPVAFRTWRV